MDVRLTRRALVAFVVPGPPVPTPELAEDGRVLRWTDLPGTIGLPGLPARTMAIDPVAGARIAALALTSQGTDSMLEIMLLAYHDGKLPFILALEPLQWQAPGGRMNTRLTSDPAKSQVLFDRSASLRKTQTLWKRENWVDALKWDGAALVDNPVRRIMAGTVQARLAAYRARALAWSAGRRTGLTAADLAGMGLVAEGFDLG